MKRVIYFLILFIYVFNYSTAQIFPANNAVIGHTQVMYDFDAVKEADRYLLKVYKLPERKLIQEQESQHPVMLVHDLLEFGQSYEWGVTAYNNHKIVKKLGPFRFSISPQPKANPALTQISITTNIPEQYVDGLIIIDNGYVVNRAGKLVYIIDKTLALPRATDITPQKTFIYIDSIYAIERDYNGKVLWKSRLYKTDTMKVVAYHHDIIKTSRGTMMAMVILNYPQLKQQVKYSGIIEVDTAHNILWYWSEKDFYPNDSTRFKASHANSIYFDEQNQKIYISNRDLNSVARIDKSTSQVDYSYGWNIDSIVPYFINPYFKMQHRVRKLPNGNLLVYNNDSAESMDLARTSVIEITDPELGEADLVWEYKFDFENIIENYVTKMGGAVELPNNNILISTGIFDRVFEVNRAGDIVWECRTTVKKSINDKQDFAPPSYRANFTTSLFPYHSKMYIKLINNEEKYVLYNAGSESQTFLVYIDNNTTIPIELGAGGHHIFEDFNATYKVFSTKQMQYLQGFK
jgi:hypothetical protein